MRLLAMMNFPLPKSPSRLRRVLGFTAVMIGLALAPAAVGASVPDPAVDMYAEHIPDPEGDKPTKKTKLGDERNDLPPRVQKKLKGQGADGERVVLLAGASSEGDAGTGGSARSGSDSDGAKKDRTGDKPGAVGSGQDDSGEPAVVAAGSGLIAAGGLGLAFPLILMLTAIAAVVVAWLRRNSPDRI